MIRREDVFKIGRMGKPHGVKGEVSMQCDDDVFDRVDADYLVLDVDGILVPFFIEEYRFRFDDVVLMKLEDIDSEQQARELTGCDVYFPHSLADNGESTEVSWQQLQGFEVLDHQHDDRVVGRVAGVDVGSRTGRRYGRAYSCFGRTGRRRRYCRPSDRLGHSRRTARFVVVVAKAAMATPYYIYSI